MQRPVQLICSAPRAYLFVRSGLRSFSSSPRNQKETTFGFSGPAPPRLPKEQQDIFEELQKQSTGAFSTPRAPPKINQSPDSSPAEVAQADHKIEARVEKLQDEFDKKIEARGKGEELHPNLRRGAQPEFEGERNPKTGEVGGPKNEPLRWGAAGEWSYNGRTTDF